MKIVGNMKQLSNKLGESSLLSLFLVLCLACSFAGCTDTNYDRQYINDTHLSVLQESRASLKYLLDNSKYGTTPGTYPKESQDILSKAIEELDLSITKLETGNELDDVTIESVIAKANQAIDAFKDSRLYNLSESARKFILQLQAEAADLEEIYNDGTIWGNHQGQYPLESKAILEKAIENLYDLVERIQSGAIADMTQELYDEAIQAANEAMQRVEDSKWAEDHLTWNLFVDGNKGGWIDFGYSEDYVKFGENTKQAFTIELWVNIKEYCNKPGEDNSTFLATMTQKDYWSGWRAQDRTKGLMRTMVAHWQDAGPSNPQAWEPGWKKSDNWTKNRWTHYAFLFKDDGLPGFDTPTDVKCYSMMDGSRQGEIVRVEEKYRTYINDNCIKYQSRMTGFCILDNEGNRNEYLSGSIKKIRIWKTNRTEDQIRLSYLGNDAIDPTDPNLVAAWDFEVLGQKPAGTTITDITGRHTATLKGTYEWVENTTIKQ